MFYNYLIYDNTNGQLLRMGKTTSEELRQIQVAPEGTTKLDVDAEINLSDYYILDGQVTQRPTLTQEDVTIMADGIDSVVVDNIPSGSRLVIDNEDYGVLDDDSLTFSTTEAHEYHVQLLLPFPYQDLSFKVNAT